MKHKEVYLKPETKEIPLSEEFLGFCKLVGENKDFFSRTTLENSTIELTVPNIEPYPWAYD